MDESVMEKGVYYYRWKILYIILACFQTNDCSTLNMEISVDILIVKVVEVNEVFHEEKWARRTYGIGGDF